MRLALLAAADDLIAAHVADLARARGAEVVRLDYHGLQPLAWDGEAWLIGGVELTRMRGVFVRALPPRGAILGAADQTFTAEQWWRAGLAQIARADVAEGCLRDLRARGVRVVSAPSPYDAKPTQLALFQREGLPIPRTLISNFGPALEAFARDVGEVVIKPVEGGAEARLWVPGEAWPLERPTLAQARVRGDDVRVTLVGGRVCSAVEIESQTLDYRSGEDYRAGRARYRVHTLTPAGVALAERAAALTEQALSGVDLKHHDGHYTLLEANSAPVYLDIERKTGAPISAALVDYLLGLDRPAAPRAPA